MRLLEQFLPSNAKGQEPKILYGIGESMASEATVLTAEEERLLHEQTVLDEALERLRIVTADLNFTHVDIRSAVVTGMYSIPRTTFAARLVADTEYGQLCEQLPEEFFHEEIVVRIESHLDELLDPKLHLDFSVGESVVSLGIPLSMYDDQSFATAAYFRTYSEKTTERSAYQLSKADILAVVALVEALVFSYKQAQEAR